MIEMQSIHRVIAALCLFLICLLKDKVNSLENVAQGKPTRQSSTFYGGVPSRAVDGNKNITWGGSSCTHTNRQFRPWWRADLQDNYDVGEVRITNRGDCCSNRLRQIEVKVGMWDNPDRWNFLCKYHAGTIGRGQTVALSCSKVIRGKYVFVKLRATEYLTLCEVEVFEDKAKTQTTCEGDVDDLFCWTGESIHITSAEYGRKNRETCPHSSINTTNCGAARSLQVVKNRCQGKPHCSVVAVSREFGDPCVGTYKYLSVNYVCQYLVYSNGSVARGKPSKQSSTAYGGVPSRAVDGNKNANWTGYSCTHTGRQKNPWWRVDLQGIHNVNKVIITNRRDCCFNRFINFEIRVGMTDNKPDANTLCMDYLEFVGKGTTLELLCRNPVAGRFVFITLKSKEYLTLCEVEVFTIKAYSHETCEGDISRILCPYQEKIYIANAEYGRQNGLTCPSTSVKTTTCKASSSLQVVKKACHGRRMCSISATNEKFGDPCVGTYKYLSITYLCYKPAASLGKSKHRKVTNNLEIGLGISFACLFILLCILRPKIIQKWHERSFCIARNQTDTSSIAQPTILTNERVWITPSNAARTTIDSSGQHDSLSSSTAGTASQGSGPNMAPVSVIPISYSDAPPAYADAMKYASPSLSDQSSNNAGLESWQEEPPPYSSLDDPEQDSATLLDPNIVAFRITTVNHSPMPDATTVGEAGILSVVEEAASSNV